MYTIRANLPRLICCIFLLSLSACNTKIIHDINESEANEIMAALQKNGIAGEKLRTLQGKEATYTIQVGRNSAVSAWRVLRENNLPRPQRKGLGEVFQGSSLVPSAHQELAMIHHALAGELAKTLLSVEGVREARVHVVQPKSDPLAPSDAPRPTPRASVLLQLSDAAPLNKEQVQRLVAGAVDGLKPEAVVVLMIKNHEQRALAATPALTQVGPFGVAIGSATPLRITLALGLVLVLLLGVLFIIMVQRHRSLLRRVNTPADGSLHNLESSLGLVERSLSRYK